MVVSSFHALLRRLSKKSFVGFPLATSSLAVGRLAAKQGSLRSPRGRLVASLPPSLQGMKCRLNFPRWRPKTWKLGDKLVPRIPHHSFSKTLWIFVIGDKDICSFKDKRYSTLQSLRGISGSRPAWYQRTALLEKNGSLIYCNSNKRKVVTIVSGGWLTILFYTIITMMKVVLLVAPNGQTL